MIRSELYEKYTTDVNAVANANAVTVWVAEDMIRSICEVRLGMIEGEILYKGLREDFPCREYLIDYYGDTEPIVPIPEESEGKEE